jgi:hypothetical protein
MGKHLHAHLIANILQAVADQILPQRRIAEQKNMIPAALPAHRQVFL